MKLETKISLINTICAATGIDLLHLWHLKKASIAAGMSWMSKRNTTRSEDMTYSLLGLFDVYMPLLSGEGSNAFIRLQQEIVKSSNDETIFAWTDDSLLESGMLAPSPTAFAKSGDVITFQHPGIRRTPYSITNLGLAIEVDTRREREYHTRSGGTASSWKMLIACTRRSERRPLMISLRTVGEDTVRFDMGKLRACSSVIIHNCYQLIYVKPMYRYRTSEWHEPALEIRWNKFFEGHMEYCGQLSGHLVSEQMNRDGMLYSDYARKTIKLNYLVSGSASK